MNIQSIWTNPIDPKNKFKQVWDIFIVVISLSAILQVPLFPIMDEVSYNFYNGINWIFTILLSTDVIIKFRSGSYNQETKDGNPKPNFWKPLLYFDVIAALPIGLLTSFFPQAKSLNYFRLFKAASLVEFIQKLEQVNITNFNALRLINFLVIIFITAHWAACVWIILEPARSNTLNFSEYFEGFYWAITTLASVGYGEIVPETRAQRIYALVIMLLGVGFYSYVLGNIVNLLANLDVAKAYYLQRMQTVSAFLKYKNIPPALQSQIIDYYNYTWEHRTGNYELDTLADLPKALSIEVKLYLNRELVQKVPLFKDAEPDLIRDIVVALGFEISTPGEYIIKKGDIGDSMYFLSKGNAEVILPDGRVFPLKAGSFFGEIALLKSIPRTASIRAKDYCELYYLEKEVFDKVLVRYAYFSERVKAEAERLLDKDKQYKEKKDRYSEIIQKVPLFQDADSELIGEIIIALKSRSCNAGEFIVRKGELGDSMYFINKGSAEVIAEDGETVVVTLKDGNFFGEIALLNSIPRTVSVRATDYCELAYLEKEAFDKVLEKFPTFSERVEAVAEERLSNDEQYIQKKELYKDMIKKVPLLQTAESALIREILLALQSRNCNPGEFVVRKGEIGDSMYFLGKGSVEVIGEDGKTVILTLKDGSFFGEIALLKSIPRTVSVRATEDCELVYLEKEAFDKILEKFPSFAKQVQDVAEQRLSNDEKLRQQAAME